MIESAGRELDLSRAWVEVHLAAIRANASSLVTSLGPGVALMAVVKADAYGHGLLPVAHAALDGGARWLGVATAAEGSALRGDGIDAPIALLCSPPPADAPAVAALGLTAMVGDAEFAAALGATRGGRRLEVHLDIDTGMGRAGVLPEHAVAFWRQCLREGLTVTGVCTHFADADGVDPELTLLQWERFAAARQALESAGARFEWVHASNSAATIRYPANRCNLVRPGLLLYGLRPLFAGKSVAEDVRPVLALKARVGGVRELPAGHTVSYGATCRLTRPSRVATVLIGYGDGYPRRLSNRGSILLRGCQAPILGRVCMDQTVVDVTDIPGVVAGDIATCIGTDGAEAIAAEDIARLIETTEHEITTCLTGRLPRVYRKESMA